MITLLSIFDKNSNLIAYNNSLTLDTFSASTNTYVIAPRQELRAVAAFLKLNSLSRVTNAIDITAVDNLNSELRFNVNYQLQSITTNTR
jgi:NADH:ubiquinone oxidoreductase subunit C